MSATWVFAIMVVSIVCLGITVQAEDDSKSFSTADDGRSFSTAPAPAPSPSNQLPMSPINIKVYTCSERCVNNCMKEAGEYPVYTKCTIRTLVDGVYNCTFGCTKSLSTKFATGMADVENYFGTCYNSCKNH